MTDKGQTVKLLGLDVGDVRIGVAVSDPSGMVVETREAVRAGTRAGAIEQIAGLVEREGVGEVVVGMPVSLGGGVGGQGEKTRVFAELLAEQISVPVRTWDESYSSRAADGIMREAGVKRGRKKGKRDSVAAAVILREYLEMRRSEVGTRAGG